MSEKESIKPRTNRSHEEDIKFEISFYESLIQKDPNFIDALIPLADNYTQAGHYEAGLKIDLKLSELLPKDPVVHYNLACSYSLLNRIPEASEILKKAIILGYKDFDYIEQDPDLSNFRAQPNYYEIKKEFFKTP
jgi:tetratricopeptide (TPR) repeat protein